jgi:hypothetical protein
MSKLTNSSIDGGIFGEQGQAQQAPVSARGRAMTGSSIEGGIFGAGPAPAPRAQKQGITDSSLAGGLFAEPACPSVNEPRSAVTKSSVPGGIFNGSGDTAAPRQHAPKAEIDQSRVAGRALPQKGEAFSLFTGEGTAPLAPLPSARSNPNASSVEGGIFGPPTAQKPMGINRSNPNQPSQAGGIFGA